MAEESLKIQIGADVTGFNTGVSQVEKGLANLQPAAQKAGNVLTSLSRVASDAPFGFIAIQNNLEPLIQSFGSLQASSGGTGAALKSLAASLAGPAGLAVGFSVVSALITTTIQKYGSLGNAIDLLLTSGNEEVKYLQTVSSLRKEAIEDASTEIAKLDVLAAVSQDTTNSQENRTEAAKKLLEVYGEYLPKVTEEAILNGKAADAINRAKDAILNKALAAAAEAKVAEIGKKLLDVKLQQVDAEKQLTQARKDNQDTFSTEEYVNAQNDAVVNADKNVNTFKKQAQDLQAEYEKLIKLTKDFAKTSGDAYITDKKTRQPREKRTKDDTEARLRNLIELYKKEAELIKINSGKYSDAYNEALKKVASTQAELETRIAVKAKNIEGVDIIRKELENKFKEIDQKTSFRVPISPILQATIPKDFDLSDKKLELKPKIVFSPEVQAALDEQRKRIFNFESIIQDAQRSAEVLSTVLNPVVDSFFGALESGKNIVKSLGETIKSFVLNAIKQFVKLAAISAIVSAITPGLGFGAAFKNFGGIGSVFGIGGGIGGAAPIGGIRGAGLAMSVSGQFVQRGTDLVAVINQSNQRINRVG